MKILMLNYEFPPLGGGSSIANYYILKELAKIEGLEIHLVTSSSNKFRIEAFSSSIKIHFLDIGKNGEFHFQSFTDLLKYSYKAYKYSKKLIEKENFQLIHAFFGIPSGYIAMKLGLPYIVSLRGSDVPFHTPRFKVLDLLLFKRLSKKIWKKAKFVVANSKGLKEEALQTNPEQKIEVIYNGVDISEFKPFDKKHENETITFISTGRLAKHKAYHFLIQALSGIEKVRLVLIGDGKQYEELKVLANNLNVMVDFRGKLEHSKIVAELQKADVFVLPSITEGMSNSLLEAIACGLPVLVTNVGGSEELIKGNGFIVEKGNARALREKIQVYLNDKKLLKVQAKASVEIAKSMSWERVAKRYFEIYHIL
jgi:glycosyltransferase involved in cell wall biosynthesis